MILTHTNNTRVGSLIPIAEVQDGEHFTFYYSYLKLLYKYSQILYMRRGDNIAWKDYDRKKWRPHYKGFFRHAHINSHQVVMIHYAPNSH
jgi:hypothetical protein